MVDVKTTSVSALTLLVRRQEWLAVVNCSTVTTVLCHIPVSWGFKVVVWLT